MTVETDEKGIWRNCSQEQNYQVKLIAISRENSWRNAANKPATGRKPQENRGWTWKLRNPGQRKRKSKLFGTSRHLTRKTTWLESQPENGSPVSPETSWCYISQSMQMQWTDEEATGNREFHHMSRTDQKPERLVTWKGSLKQSISNNAARQTENSGSIRQISAGSSEQWKWWKAC
jgi:hypothetical protein